MSIFKRKEFDVTVRLIPPGQVSLTGMHLENEVRKALGLSADWELSDMQELLTFLGSISYTVALTTCRSGWKCCILKGDQLTENSDCAQEYGNESPSTALARAALVAVREWGW